MKKTMLGLAILFSLYGLGVIMIESANPLDIAKAVEVRAMGIKPNEPFYESTRVTVGRIFPPFHNYPEYPPISFTQAENTLLRVYSPFETQLKIAQVGDNYQYKEILTYTRKPQQILLNQEHLNSLKQLENGAHFFILNNDFQLQAVTNPEEVIILPNYIKVVRKMGKIISIEKKPLVSVHKQEYQYWSYTGEVHYSKSIRYDINKKNALETMLYEYDKEGRMVSRVKINSTNHILAKKIFYPEGGEYYSEETLFNELGEKTNVIYILTDGSRQNHYIDEHGEVTHITTERMPEERFLDFDEDELYKKLTIDVSKKYRTVPNLEPEK